MSFFTLRVPDDPRVLSWLKLVRRKLRGHDVARIPFEKDMKFLPGGVVVFDLQPLFPRFLGWLVLIPCTVIAFLAAAFGYSLGWVFWLGGVFFTLWELFWTPLLYLFIVWIQVRRITGEWQKVRLDNDSVIRWVLYGKI